MNERPDLRDREFYDRGHIRIEDDGTWWCDQCGRRFRYCLCDAELKISVEIAESNRKAK